MSIHTLKQSSEAKQAFEFALHFIKELSDSCPNATALNVHDQFKIYLTYHDIVDDTECLRNLKYTIESKND